VPNHFRCNRIIINGPYEEPRGRENPACMVSLDRCLFFFLMFDSLINWSCLEIVRVDFAGELVLKVTQDCFFRVYVH
jgi:hypothetical protein